MLPLSSLERNLTQAVPINNAQARAIINPLRTAKTSPRLISFFVTFSLIVTEGIPDKRRLCRREEDSDGDRSNGICCSGDEAEADREIRKLVLLFLPTTGFGPSCSQGESSSAEPFPPSDSESPSIINAEGSRVFCNRSVAFRCLWCSCLRPKIPRSCRALRATKTFRRY